MAVTSGYGAAPPASRATVIGCCLVAALFEGLDIQSMGVAAPRLAADLAIDPARLGLVMSGSSLGLLVGAAVGGRLSDRHGRRPVLIAALAALGLFSLATAAADAFSTLLAARILAGLGLRGVFPMLIAMTTEAASPSRRATALALVYCGLPAGGMAAGAIAGMAGSWRAVFVAGGVGPLAAAALLAWLLAGDTRSKAPPVVVRPAASDTVSALTTPLLWLAYLLTLLIVYALLNWLPSLLADRGVARSQAAAFAIVLNGGAVIGSLAFGWIADRLPRSRTLAATYIAMALAMVALAFSRGDWIPPAVFLAGFAVIGGQLILYALAPAVYPAGRRGAGVGAAVAAGRLGSIAGPASVGLAVGAGVSPAEIPLAALPLLAAAAMAALLVSAAIRD